MFTHLSFFVKKVKMYFEMYSLLSLILCQMYFTTTIKKKSHAVIKLVKDHKFDEDQLASVDSHTE